MLEIIFFHFFYLSFAFRMHCQPLFSYSSICPLPRIVVELRLAGGVGLLVMLLLEEEEDDDERLDLSPTGPRCWPALDIGPMSTSMPTARLGSEGRDIVREQDR